MKNCMAICYKTKTPTYYNKGTQWETSRDTFAAYYTYQNEKDAMETAERLNRERPATLFNGQKINWENIDHFFAESAEMPY